MPEPVGPVRITCNLDLDPWTDLQAHTVAAGAVARVGLRPDGTTEGRPAVALAITVDTDRVVLGHLTWELWKHITVALSQSPAVAIDRLEQHWRQHGPGDLPEGWFGDPSGA